VTDRLDGLGHDLVVGGHHQHDDVGDLRAASAHRGERLVARRIEEGDALPSRQAHVVRADVLGDATGLACDDVRLADVVEQRRLAVVDVTHDGDHGRPRDLRSFVLDFGRRFLLGHVLALAHGLEAEGARDQLDLVEVEPLVHRDHQPQLLERELDNLNGRHLHDLGELRDRDEFVDADAGLFALGLLGRATGEQLAIGRLVTPALAARWTA
jgi:hypothetical protein